MNDKERLAAFFTSHPKETFKTGDVMKALELDRSRRRQVKKSLDELETEGKIHRYKGGRWGQFQLSNVLTGTVSIARKGYGFLRPDPVADSSENSVAPPDVFLPQKDLGGAMNGDRVSVRVTRREEQDGPR
ncbi:MAG TPA: hypothetical protein PLB62_10855, partial [Candidatus Sumerlaeota bacterium]|nr:hypothetical protein [Candidatus Sumerlaeota bacterium]